MSLKERRELVAMAAGQGTGVLVTLVRVAGSSYRAPGARLLVLPDGRTAGTISGGCLEADLLRKALWTVRNGAAIERYNTSFDDTAEIPYGLGCGGEVDLLLEPLGTPEADAALLALDATLNGEERRMLTVLPPAPKGEGPTANGQGVTPRMPFGRIVLDRHGDVLFASENIETEQVVTLRRSLLNRVAHTDHLPSGNPERRNAWSTDGIFAEQIAPAQRLVIFGAGEDAKPLARMAAQMGWTVLVADGRAQHARPERFPEAHIVRVATSAAALPVLPADAAVLMTHSYEQDRRLLTELLQIQPRYIGLLGARHRSALLLQEAGEAAGVHLRSAVERTFAPVGLSFGGDGPEAIALSITAQIQAELQNRGGMVTHRRMDLAEVELLLLREDAASARVDLCPIDLADALLPAANAV